MEKKDQEKLETALTEIKDGIGGVMTRINEVETKTQGQLGEMTAKFVDIEKDSKEVSAKLATFEGKLISMSEYLRDRKLGLGISIPGLEEEIKRKKFSLGRVMACMGMIALEPAESKSIWEKYAPFEYEVGKETRKKAIDTGTAGAGGGYLIPQEYLAAEFVDLLRANLVVVAAGARMVTGLTGAPARVPGQLTASTPYWVAQNATITKSNPTFGEVTMTPKTMGMRAQISNLSLLMENPDVEALVRQDFASVAALEIDRVALRGAGTAEPLGITNTPNIPTIAMGAAGGAFTWDSGVDFEGKLEDATALKGSLAYIMSAKVKRLLKKTRIPQFSGDTAGQYIVPPILSDAIMRDMLGYAFHTSTQIPTDLTKTSGANLSEIYFGNWNDLIIGMWGAVEILASNIGGDAWAQGSVEIRLMQNLDVLVRRLASFVIATDVFTTASGT